MFIVIQCCTKTGHESELATFKTMSKAYAFLMNKQAAYPDLEYYILPELEDEQFGVYIVDGCYYWCFVGNI